MHKQTRILRYEIAKSIIALLKIKSAEDYADKLDNCDYLDKILPRNPIKAYGSQFEGWDELITKKAV